MADCKEEVHTPVADCKVEARKLVAVHTAAVAVRMMEEVRKEQVDLAPMVAQGAALMDPAPIGQMISGRQTTP